VTTVVAATVNVLTTSIVVQGTEFTADEAAFVVTPLLVGVVECLVVSGPVVMVDCPVM
jgi:hypothetical protein